MAFDLSAFHQFPMWIAFVAAIALVLAMWCAVVYAVIDVIVRAGTDRR